MITFGTDQSRQRLQEAIDSGALARPKQEGPQPSGLGKVFARHTQPETTENVGARIDQFA